VAVEPQLPNAPVRKRQLLAHPGDLLALTLALIKRHDL
jgi:hypothetical protein